MQSNRYRRPEHSEIKHKNMRFLITDRPNDQNVERYIQDLSKFNASVVVRVCEPSYSKNRLEEQGIKVIDAAFEDGQTPPPEIRQEWFHLLKDQFRQNPNTCVAIHCVAGLGRAPVMVAMALMELGMSYEEAVELIRSKRRGALNTKQLQFLEGYRPKNRLKSRSSPCNIM
ncbi:tyrosine phosphatase type IVA 1 [Brachionus plicatilis]|uniref:Protein tyrosine phosphatase type IVA 3 n=1 Tax=Brachionus plicatilis TaxID=10195 RepID=A0A3M7RPG7_BRAPC|nr:tyrosine phosphatase type IVA 1 [Brachionus plicatilis]